MSVQQPPAYLSTASDNSRSRDRNGEVERRFVLSRHRSVSDGRTDEDGGQEPTSDRRQSGPRAAFHLPHPLVSTGTRRDRPSNGSNDPATDSSALDYLFELVENTVYSPIRVLFSDGWYKGSLF